MEDNDAAAIEQARAGSSEAFRVLVERHSRAVFRLAYRMTGNEQDAEDTVRETFLRAYRQIGRFDSRSRFSAWLFTIAANCSLDLPRKRWRRTESAENPLDVGPFARAHRRRDGRSHPRRARRLCHAPLRGRPGRRNRARDRPVQRGHASHCFPRSLSRRQGIRRRGIRPGLLVRPTVAAFALRAHPGRPPGRAS